MKILDKSKQKPVDEFPRREFIKLKAVPLLVEGITPMINGSISPLMISHKLAETQLELHVTQCHLVESNLKNDAITRLMATQSILNSNLCSANESLVILSLKLQKITEELEISKRELLHLAAHDPLTGLPNRRVLHENLTQTLVAADQQSFKVAVLFIDLDKFKIVNDSFGHAVGDSLLSSVAMRIRGTLRVSDFVSRIGGDEFVVVISDFQGDDLKDKIEELHKVVSAPYLINSHAITIGASIGVSMFPEDGTDSDRLLLWADQAMYKCKAAR